VLVTPAHQSPTGAALSAAGRAGLVAWARSREALLIEDDYDAEFRYDRKTLAPALRLGWLVLPERLVDTFAEHKRLADAGSPTLEQLALAHLIESGDY